MTIETTQRLLRRAGWRETHFREGVAVWQKAGGNVALFLSPVATFRSVVRLMNALGDSD